MHVLFHKKITVIIATVVVGGLIIGTGWWYYHNNARERGITGDVALMTPDAVLDDLRAALPQISEDIDQIAVQQQALQDDPTAPTPYISLGLAWKSVGEFTASPETQKRYFEYALSIYERGITATNRANTVLLVNAANMSQRLGDFTRAEALYHEALTVGPDAATYIALAELYEYKLNKSVAEVVAVYDEGLKKLLETNLLEITKAGYLNRHAQ